MSLLAKFMKKKNTAKPAKVRRPEVMQAFLDLYDAPRYLEIGVAKGRTFHALKAAHKVAVDPKFKFDLDAAKAENPNAAYHQVTSDEYFGSIRKPDEQFDVVYIDGLHTADQTIRDLLNVLLCTHERSVIIIDDVRPSSYAASMHSIPQWQQVVAADPEAARRGWMGDVYRLVQFVESFLQGLSYAVIEDNHGQLVAWRKTRPAVAGETLEAVSRAPYEAIFLNPAHQRQPLAAIRERVVKDVFGG